MWDGWPYWKPMPVVVTSNWHGAKHIFFSSVFIQRKSDDMED
jgi:hypothetical protein